MNDLSVTFKREQTEGRCRVTVSDRASVSVALKMKQVIEIGRLVGLKVFLEMTLY